MGESLSPGSSESGGSGTITIEEPVSVDDNGGSLTVDGPLTDDELRATPVPVNDGGGSLTVDGTVSVTNFQDVVNQTFGIGDVDNVEAAGDGSIIAILKRLRTLLSGGLPAALAAGGGLKVEGVSGGVAQPVTFPTYTAPVSGELQGNVAATQGPNVACKMVMFTALGTNAGKVYLGVAGVTKADGTTDTTSGIELAAGASTPWIPVDNLNRLYRICDNAGDDLTYLAMN